MTGDSTNSETAGEGLFDKTNWTLIFNAARNPADSCARDAMQQLCNQYYKPVFYTLRRMGKTKEQAEDLAQGFFVSLLQGKIIPAADPSKGAFHSFLLRCLKNYVTNEYWKGEAAKRKPPGNTSEPKWEREPADTQTPTKLMDRHWAWALVEQAVERLQENYRKKGNDKLFEALSPTLMGESLDQKYSELAKTLGYTEEALRMKASRMRKELRDVLKDVLCTGSDGQIDVKAELKVLQDILRSS